MYRSEACDELWVDALDEWEYLPAPCPTPGSSDNTMTSETGAKIVSLDLPAIDGWSSFDSWTSALSDWIQSVSVLPEDDPTKRCPESQQQFSVPIQDMTMEKVMSLESSFEVEDKDLEPKVLMKNSTSPPVELSLLNKEERGNILDTSLDMTRTPDSPVDMEEERESGFSHDTEESWNDGSDERVENKVSLFS